MNAWQIKILFRLFFTLGGVLWFGPLIVPDPGHIRIAWVVSAYAAMMGLIVVGTFIKDDVDSLIPFIAFVAGLSITGNALMLFQYFAWPVAGVGFAAILFAGYAFLLSIFMTGCEDPAPCDGNS